MNDIAQYVEKTNQSSTTEEGSFDSSSIILFVVVAIGLVGNVLAIGTIFHSRLRKISANQYLIVLTLADSVFLFMLLMVAFKIDYLSYEICVVVEYILMTSSYISSWSIAALTIERYIAIAHPLKQLKYGHVSRLKIMLYWVPIPFILNLIQFVNFDRSDLPNSRKCQVMSGTLQAIIEPADVLLSYLMPCLVVIGLNLLIAAKVEKSKKDFMKTLGASSVDFSKTSKRSGSSSGSMRILFIVPVAYTLLNTPFYLFRIADVINRVLFNNEYLSTSNPYDMNPIVGQMLNIAHYLYYGNFACDFIVYAFSSAHFRKTAVIAWQTILCPHWPIPEKESLINPMRYTRSCHEISTIPKGSSMKPMETNLSLPSALRPSKSESCLK